MAITNPGRACIPNGLAIVFETGVLEQTDAGWAAGQGKSAAVPDALLSGGMRGG